MPNEKQGIEDAIAALQAQRSLLGDVVVDASVAALHARLTALAEAVTPPPPLAEQSLRQVSMLFVDVVGSTPLSQHLDPEDTAAVMDGFLRRGTAIVQSHRGRVVQYAGDSMLAVFGAEMGAEDDAERAVRCGLGLLDLGRMLGAEVQAAHGQAGCNVRVGIHTGGVLLGGGGGGAGDEGAIRGLAVNVAARMEQTAPSGALRISQETYALVRGLFEVDVQEPLVVKGVDTPVQSFLVTRAKSRNFRIGTRGIEGVATNMIGRDAELEQLQAAFKRVFATRRLAAVTVVADAGIGKSRLLYEFEAWSETRPEAFFLFRGRATPQTGTRAFGLLRDIFAWRFQIDDDDSIEAARQKMEDGIVPLFVHDDGPELAHAHAHLLGHLIGIEWKDSRYIAGILDDPKQIRNRAFHAAAQLFRRVGASDGSPVVLQLDDLHWADDESLDFLNYLTEVDRDVPLLVLSFTRPTLFERRTDWGSTAGLDQRIDLAPLGKDMSRVLANELLKKLPEVPAALRELVTSSAEGNPFYMEELVKMLIDQGAILTRQGSGEAWSVSAERLLATQVPPTLTGVLQARLDGLPKAEKRALQQASIVGSVFWDKALAAIEAEAAELLPALVKRELAVPRTDAVIDGLREYAFRHQVLHQVTYDTVLKRYKRDGHAKVARWLAALAESGIQRAGDFLGTVAEHFEQAGDAANAAEFHTGAAEQAGQRFAHDRVLAHVGRALALLAEVDASERTGAAMRWRLLRAREATLSVQGRHDELAVDLDAMDRLADMLDDDSWRAFAALRRSLNAQLRADWATQVKAARSSLAAASRAGDDELRMRALRQLALGFVMAGDIEGGQAMARQALPEAQRLGLRNVEGLLLNVLLMAGSLQSDVLGVLELTRQTLVISRETNNRLHEAISLINQGEQWVKMGDLAQGRRGLDAGLQMTRATGDRRMESGALFNLSAVALWQGDETRALALARQAADLAVAAQARQVEVWACLRLGDAELALGRQAAAREAYLQAHARAVEIKSGSQHDASAGLARVALVDRDTAATLAAVVALKPVIDHVDAGGTLNMTDYPRQIELTCYRALARGGDPRAAGWLKRAHDALMADAEAIGRSTSDATLREGFLQNIPHHREIVAAWAKSDAARDPQPPQTSTTPTGR